MTGNKLQRTPLILLSSPRCGTNYFRELVNQHECVHILGELFNPVEDRRKQFGRGYYQLDRENPITFMNRVFNGSFKNDPQVLGFKVFYQNARRPPGRNIWSALASIENLHIIEIYRDNLFEQYASLQLALATNRWMLKTTETLEPQYRDYQHYIDPKAFVTFVERLRRLRKESWSHLSEARRLTFTYNELCSNRNPILQKAFEFIGVTLTKSLDKFADTLQKQAVRPIPQQVSNYDQLRQHFKGTKYEQFFS